MWKGRRYDQDYKDMIVDLFKYIEGWYNRKRIHSSINYMTSEKC